MGFRVAVFLGFVLFLSGGNLCSAAQNRSVLITNETPHQMPQDQVTRSSEVAAHRQLNQSEQRHLVLSPATFQLRIYHLRKPADKQKPLHPYEEQKLRSLQPKQLNSDCLDQKESIQAREMLKLPIQGQDMNLPVKKKSKVQVRFKQRVPVPAESVSVRCEERKVTIAVKQDFLGNGQLIRPRDLSLGGCAAVAAVDRILLFRTELHNCGSTVMMTEESLVYSFSLMYSPAPIGNTSILKTNPAEMMVQCHYERKHYVSSGAIRPTWKTFASKMQADQRLHFSLHLMTEDWQSQRPSNVYSLSDVIHMEASVLQGHHVPLRVFVDSCMATVNPDPSSQPRYPLIRNYGCLTDSKLTGAQSYFTQRNQENKLHFQFRTIKFDQDDRNALYMTCRLKATTVDFPVDSQHKACSFLTEAERWVASGGDNNVCSCCETRCSGKRQRRSLAADAALQWEGMAALGPILLDNSVQHKELTVVADLPLEPVPQHQAQEGTQAATYSSTALLCGAGASLAAALLFTSTVICSRLRKPTGHSVCT
ncbi:zona pellucida sperm-binding protein 3-like [Leuresthes tenuis]|uniref:zona pellucida sperm-binding protein 3-like n=1 Tax=Leuresthes tenuis TaxID=355514 RepID=UPI003B509680